MISVFAIAQKTIQPPFMQKEWSQDYEPFRLVGNVYYVGTYDLASYFITTPKGHILINTGLAESAEMIRAHVEKLGFKFKDIKILLATHTHYDHVGAMAAIKKKTGATMMVHEKDASALADGGNSDFLFGGKGSTFQPVKAERLLHDRDTVSLGGTSIVMLHHPGHTPGASSFLLNTRDEKRSYRLLIANMPSVLDETNLAGMSTYPDVGKDYAYTMEVMPALQFDVWVASHASQFGLHDKRKPGDGYRPEVFADQKGYDETMARLKANYLKRRDGGK
ncbi:subclass B3 metallo-beta-lactamase [Chryseolinea lacunae]